MLNEVPASKRASLIQKVADYFDITTFSFKGRGREKSRDEFIFALKSNTSKNSIGIFMKDRPELYLLILKPGVAATVLALASRRTMLRSTSSPSGPAG